MALPQIATQLIASQVSNALPAYGQALAKAPESYFTPEMGYGYQSDVRALADAEYRPQFMPGLENATNPLTIPALIIGGARDLFQKRKFDREKAENLAAAFQRNQAYTMNAIRERNLFAEMAARGGGVTYG